MTSDESRDRFAAKFSASEWWYKLAAAFVDSLRGWAERRDELISRFRSEPDFDPDDHDDGPWEGAVWFETAPLVFTPFDLDQLLKASSILDGRLIAHEPAIDRGPIRVLYLEVHQAIDAIGKNERPAMARLDLAFADARLLYLALHELKVRRFLAATKAAPAGPTTPAAPHADRDPPDQATPDLVERLRLARPTAGIQIALLKFMEGRDSVPVEDVASGVHGDPQTSGKAISANIKRVNGFLEGEGASFRLHVGSGRVYRDRR